MSIGSSIRKERNRQKLTLKKLAEMADISVSYLGDIEKERCKPSVERLKDISKALGKNVAYFIDEEGFLEEEKRYLAIEEEIRELIDSLLAQEGFLEILQELKGFEYWSKREKAELLGFLRAKNSFEESCI